MQRLFGACILLLLASTSLGCAMCAAPFDYTGPVPADGLGFNDRMGSILQGTAPSDAVFDSEVTEEAIGEPITSSMPAGAIQGEPTPAPPREPQNAVRGQPRGMR